MATPAWSQTPAETGTVRGRVFDGGTRDPLAGTTVTLVFPAAPDVAEPKQESRVTGSNGEFEFTGVPPGMYRIRLRKPGFRDSTMTDFVVVAGQENVADFPLPLLPTATSEPRPDVEEFVVVASPVEEILEASRMESDQLLNTMSAEEISKFAASDVADALRFVPGVNVVKGQFAIIRGLEDRYSSTLYNSAPVPSPDPDRQSVQLDLFPADVVTNLAIAKTFGQELPSNSSGGSINILTEEYPEETEIKLSVGSGFNENAQDRFIELEKGIAVGKEADSTDTIEDEWGGSIAGRREIGDREFRYKALFNREVDYETKLGFQEGREPAIDGDLPGGNLGLSEGRYALTESERAEQETSYLGLGIDLDGGGDHKLDFSGFFTRKDEETALLAENGYFPNADYDAALAAHASGETPQFPNAVARGFLSSFRESIFSSATLGPAWNSSFSQGESYLRDRDLLVYQLNGDHHFAAVDGLHLAWATNYARTTQQDSALGLQYFFEPTNAVDNPTSIPVTPEEEPGRFLANDGIFVSANDIDEDQWFGRFDGDYEIQLTEPVVLTLNGGYWYENSDRDVAANFLEQPSQGIFGGNVLVGATSQFQDNQDLAAAVNRELDRDPLGQFAATRTTENESSREIRAWNAGGKLTLWEDLDLLGGFRRESILIESRNDAFVEGLETYGAPRLYPTQYLFFDRLDNPARGEPSARPGTTFNSDLLGINIPVDPVTGFVDLPDRASLEALLNGTIDEKRALPSYGLTYRPVEGMSLRLALSKTVARPSFREMGYYVTVEAGSDDLVVGNPQLELSDVESWDARWEYTWGDFGDLAAVSLFKKDIQKPIESIVVRNPDNVEESSLALYRTFFNNPNDAELRGVELEARKNLSFLGPALAEYFSVGGNYTYIDAEVGRTHAELARSTRFFRAAPGTTPRFTELEKTRRLFGQPEWIGNVDVSFHQPDWRTKVTLALFMISDILDAAGTASVSPDGNVRAFTLDRYIDSYHQLDLILSQTWNIDILGGDIVFKASIKNLTDSERRVIYDPYQTGPEIPEREYQVGQDFSFSVGYKVSF